MTRRHSIASSIAGISTLHALATSPALDDTNLEAFYLEGRRVQATQPGWDTIMLLSMEGEQLVSTAAPLGTPPVRTIEAASLQRVIATKQPAVGVIQIVRRKRHRHV